MDKADKIIAEVKRRAKLLVNAPRSDLNERQHLRMIENAMFIGFFISVAKDGAALSLWELKKINDEINK